MMQNKYVWGDFMQRHLLDLQYNSETASFYILDACNDFIYKFVYLLCDHISAEELNTNEDQDLLDFLELYDNHSIEDAIRKLQKQTSHLEKDEIYHEIEKTILHIAYKYDFETDFAVFLRVCFKYMLFERLSEYQTEHTRIYEACMFENDFEFQWILNNKDKNIFSDITILQRVILKMTYIDELSIMSIADILNFDVKIIEEELDKATDVIKKRGDFV